MLQTSEHFFQSKKKKSNADTDFTENWNKQDMMIMFR